MIPYELVSYEPSHRGDYLGLLREAWGSRSMSGDEFDWWFDRNPVGSLMSVARADGRVVGVAAHSLYRMALEGEERLVSFSVHATTHASARGQGIFVALEQKHEQEAAERGVACVLAFASPPTAPLFLGPLGWTEVARLRVWARPLRALLRRRKQEGLSAPPGLQRFDFAGDAAAGWTNHVVRDAAYLNWRYLDSPRGYRALVSAGGYAVVGHKLHKGVSTAVLADLVAPSGELRGLLRRAVAAARGCEAVIALPAPEQRRAFLAAGFVPSPMTLHFMGKPLAGRLNPDPGAWRCTLGDTDFF